MTEGLPLSSLCLTSPRTNSCFLKKKTLFITPPFTQLNTPYPATAYLKGFLNTKGYPSAQADLGIEVILELFSKKGLQRLFDCGLGIPDSGSTPNPQLSDNALRIIALKADYLATINPVIAFLQNKNPTLAHSICDRSYLPEASRFDTLEELEWAFGTMGTHDKARHLATLYLEDLGDLIKEAVDPHFGFSRYAERLGSTASSFDEMERELQAPDSLVATILKETLERHIAAQNPAIICLSVPFPGNVYGAFKCGQYVKQFHPQIKIIMGGGYANTELRRLADTRIFAYLDYICLDDGELPLLNLIEHIEGKKDAQYLKRTYSLLNGVVCYHNTSTELDVPQRETGTPDYSDLPLHDYLSVIEIVNPMHRLWSDGRWNKLTLAHGCYWGKCSFCDVTLDYIQRYEPLTPALLCDRIEEIIAQTGQTGFHFVDEAAPPALMRDLALEILRRRLTVTWWTNIRFEKSFTADLCRLLKASGCIAVSGGLEVASDRLLERMKKGVTVAQVARVAHHFTEAGIMVHAYLMYGFPTQTAQETIDSLEMVRQLFENGVVQSGFWHRFAMTAHSPVGLDPVAYGVTETGPDFAGFADNDRHHDDPTGAEHDLFAEGLRKSLFNYMHGVCFDFRLADWFEFKTPRPTIPKSFIQKSIAPQPEKTTRPTALVAWHGPLPTATLDEDEDGNAVATLVFHHKQHSWELQTTPAHGQWLVDVLPLLQIGEHPVLSFAALEKDFAEHGEGDFSFFLASEEWAALRKTGLWLV
ncbi:MAG: radical SAM protein [Saprospiraceae bacterium]|nr:radical SAM protein [Saprospiraceae bacterium]MCF8251801.1 radical SAM protein [Saprospiraceae bacterium]MCF8281455.1 radical SAM protein [Bacteroidales bacterium]MCF8313515.1 radical SAM protein [Saprospiraceae bacterium]MCF8442262.1 radical SAM protein [Saprospiraceae bacterium]